MTRDIQIDKKKRKIIAGDCEFYVIQDGYYRLDGGAMYGMVPRRIWGRFEKTDEHHRLYMALNCLLVKRGDLVILVDAGIGEKFDSKGIDIFGIEKERNLIQEMDEIGVKPEDVTHVIITHLHFDHAGWIVDNSGSLTFPNARYHIQSAEWQEAQNPHVRFKDSYLKAYYGSLADSPNLVLHRGDGEIEENVQVIHLPGHSKGHQIALFCEGGFRIAHLGDVAALASQIRLNWTCGFDGNPEETIKNKAELLERAHREGWVIVTAHDRFNPAGKLVEEKGKYRLEPIFQ